MERLTVTGVTEVLVGSGLPEEPLPRRSNRQRAVVLTQPAVASHAAVVQGRLADSGLETKVLVLPDREAAKTLAVAESVYEELSEFGVTREDTVIGVGGGSVTDLAGFVAATWLRGVEAVHVPTTLLGAVDASIGGKTGVNLAGKNLVGVFWHPTRVLIDVDVLSALPPHLIREGLAESFKAGLIGDSTICRDLRANGAEAALADIVVRAIRVKATIVEKDERESGNRAFLNLGHTIGHAIEFASGLSHGESVAVGLVAAMAVSEERLGFSESRFVEESLRTLGLPVTAGGVDADLVRQLLRHDKKQDAGGLRMVLLESIEHPTLVHVSRDDVEIGLNAVGL